MAKTLDETLAGADFEGGELFCDDVYNNLKNHWRANYGGEPCGSGGLEYLQPGMIISDEYDDRLYHVLLTSGCACSEIVQDCVPLSDDKEIGFGNDWDGQIGYDELVNDALILGIPVVDHRGLIICDQADMVPNITAPPYSLGTITQPTIHMLDADLDSYLGIGHQADDRPGIWSGPNDAHPLAIQYEANADVAFFENTAVDVNRIVYIYGSEDMVRLSALAAGGFGLRIDAYQDDLTALTGLLRGAYIQASNGDEIATGTIRALELKARAGRPGEDGNDVAVLEGLSISADAKVYDITTVMRGAEVILDGGLGASVVKAVGIRIANNFQADIATLSYGLEIYRDSFDYDADIALSLGGLIGGTAGHLRISNTGVVEIWDATMTDRLFMYHDGTNAFIQWDNGTLNLQTDEADANSVLRIYGNGTGYGELRTYDEDDNEYLRLYSSGGHGNISTSGVAPGILRFQPDVTAGIFCWPFIFAGNPNFRIHGWNTASATRRYSNLRMDDVNDEFVIEAENHANHEGITISLLEANQEFRLRGVGGAERFHIDQTGILGYMRQGELFQWTYQGDLADEADFTLPAFTDACWGFIQAGDNEEYALFSVDNVGNVTLISNSANVVANANTDGKLVLGIASPEEPLTIRNRLGATENINLIIWYS